ncbi:X-X-X-Leu-X-X-Gly heptad repeat-containing protein [Mycolicibacterium rhodesiae NBB3]|uniref:X-X-X-Leu-X-X-Gly heptad repeat-containing protein n=1 Tax=Mycolicibacterium rhodesiae (strain NBB3) TaxID=710685 RepID=G8RT50_MYCRN|nr:RND family transporter [Mycolicibacterium rhodesiae]AEV72862.1 X-X-X-Leu-X-X-Gly heptad repeat-containing protein [Mycolicibacterium rhodesiae NBB3]
MRLGRVVVRVPWLVIAAWVALVVVLSIAFPPLAKIVENQTMQPLPPQAMAPTQHMAADFGDSAQNILVVVMSDDKGLQASDNDTYRALADKLRADGQDVSGVEDFVSTPALRALMVSKDDNAFYLAVTLKAPPGSPESSEAYKRVRDIVDDVTKGSDLTTHVTGQAAVVADMSIVTARDMHLIEIATAVMVMLILAVIYRRPVTALLPLITIGITVASAQGVVSALTHVGLNVTAMTVVLMTAMIVGAGTDYAVFVISRYHEYLRSGIDSDEAVQKALGSIGKVIAASAATVAVTFLGMIFTRLPAFTSVGPALAVSIAVAFFAAITLLPAILVLAGRRGWITPRAPLTSRIWQRSAINLVRRPRSHLFVSLAVLIALGGCALMMHPTFNDRMQLPDSVESNQGYTEMAAHFSTSSLLPEYIYIQSLHDLRNSQALADMEQMAQRVAQLRDINAVRGITRPTGQPLDQTKVSWQAGQVGSKLADASSQISSKTGDLDALSSGAQKLADTLAQVRDQIRTAAGSMSAITGALDQVQQELFTAQTTQLLDTIQTFANNVADNQSAVNGVISNANAMLSALNNSPQCDADPVCSDGRTKLQQLAAAGPAPSAQDVLTKVTSLSSLMQSTAAELRAAGVGDPAALQQKIAQVEQGANALADGSKQLAAGVKTLVDQTKRMGVGMNQAAGLLNSIERDASQPSMSGMYVPPQILTTSDFKNAAKLFISPNGHSARYLVESKFDPFSTQAMDQVEPILDTARAAQPNTSLADATISMVGTTPMYSAMRSDYDHDLRLIVVMTLAVVFLILVALLRALVAPLYLIASVVVSYLSALGVGVIFFQFILGQDIYWNVPATAFIVLVAVGADYNLLLITRIREESRNGIRSGIISAVRSTGGVITSAGIIFAGSMFGLLFGTLSTMVQTGFIIGVGLLIDTFVVRTITVPALASLIGRANWWPSKEMSKPAH